MLSELTAGPGAVFTVTIGDFQRALKSHFGSGAGGGLKFWEFFALTYINTYIHTVGRLTRPSSEPGSLVLASQAVEEE